MTPSNRERGPDEPAPSLADILFYAPIGLAFKAVAEYRKKASVAKFIGKMVVDQRTRRKRSPVVVAAAEAEVDLDVDVDTPETASEPFDSTTPVEPDAGSAARPAVADLPIDGYETLATRSILTLLDGLSSDDLNRVEKFERAGRQRATILHRISQLKSLA